MEKRKSNILTEVADYYSAKLAEYGETPQGVDWNGDKSQLLRFEQLSKVIDLPDNFSVNDVGCGYGALCDVLVSRYHAVRFHGYDISETMIHAARKRHNATRNARFSIAGKPTQKADFGIASGIFNVSLGRDRAEWRDYMEQTIDIINRTSIRGFAFNCLTSYSDPDKMRDYLYYADPTYFFDLCKKRYSRYVALLHDYGLYEFTILVKKNP